MSILPGILCVWFTLKSYNRLKQEFRGRVKSRNIYYISTIIGGVVFLAGAILIYPIAIILAFEDSSLSDILIYIGLSFVGVGLILVMIGMSILVIVVIENSRDYS
jgi:hypothetical protein